MRRPARLAADWAATRLAQAMGSDVKRSRAVLRHAFDAAARHGTEFVHTPSHGVDLALFQTPALPSHQPRKVRESPGSGGVGSERHAAWRASWQRSEPGAGS